MQLPGRVDHQETEAPPRPSPAVKRSSNPRDSDEEETEQPRSRKKKKKSRGKQSRTPWLLVGGTVGLIGIAVGVLFVMGIFSKKPVDNGSVKVEKGSDAPGAVATVSKPEIPGAFGTTPTLISLSRDGSKLATYSEGLLRVWNFPTGQDGITLEEPHKSDSLAISPDGRFVASSERKEVRVWEVATGKLKCKKDVDRSGPVGFSSDGLYATCERANRGVTLINTSTGTISEITNTICSSSCNLPSAPLVAINSGTYFPGSKGENNNVIDIHEIGSGKRIDGFSVSLLLMRMAYSQDGSMIAGEGHTKLYVWQRGGEWKQAAVMKNITNGIWKLQFSPDGKSLASRGVNGIEIWDIATQTSKLIRLDKCTDFEFHPKGLLLVARKGVPLAVIDPATGGELPGL